MAGMNLAYTIYLYENVLMSYNMVLSKYTHNTIGFLQVISFHSEQILGSSFCPLVSVGDMGGYW